MQPEAKRTNEQLLAEARANRPFEVAFSQRSLDASPTGILIADLTQKDAPIAYANLSAAKITGYEISELLGRNCRFLQGNDRQQPEIEVMREAITNQKSCMVTLRNFRKDGSVFWNQVSLTPIFDDAGRLVQYFAGLRDVSDYREAIDRLEKLATTDALTGLPSHERFRSFLKTRLSREDSGSIAVVVLKIGDLDEINQAFGTEVGDEVVSMAAGRLLKLQGTPLASRLLDGCFVLAMEIGCPNEMEAEIRAIQCLLTGACKIAGATISLSVSIGYTLCDRAGVSGDQFIREASVAAYQAKRAGYDEIRIFDAVAAAAVHSRLRLTGELRQAIEEEAFVAYYQPKVVMSSGAIIGAEALVRWKHPVFGLQPPSLFIPAAEESGLIAEIGAQVLRQATRFAAKLNRNRSEEQYVRIAVNVARIQIRRTEIVRQIEDALAEAGAKPEWIGIELTEDLLVEISPKTASTFEALRELGIGIALDDFGSGYSSLHYLRDLPFTEVKVDRSFISKIDRCPKNAAIVRAILQMANALEMCTTCEGIETQIERDMLSELGGKYGQGYFFSLPLDSADFEWLLQHHRQLPVQAASQHKRSRI